MSGFKNVINGVLHFVRDEVKKPEVHGVLDAEVKIVAGEILDALDRSADKTGTPIDDLVLKVLKVAIESYFAPKVPAMRLNQ